MSSPGDSDATCIICETNIDDPPMLGKKYVTTYTKIGKDDSGLPMRTEISITCHYYCLLFSANLEMKGKEDEGIRGFLGDDIVRERNRGRTLTCHFCKLRGPTSACCEPACRIAYHLPCAVFFRTSRPDAPDEVKKLTLEYLLPDRYPKLAPAVQVIRNDRKKQPADRGPVQGLGNMTIQFIDPFLTFCSIHKPPKKVKRVDVIGKWFNTIGSQECLICNEKLNMNMVLYGRYFFVQCPHCLKQAHIYCLKPYAISAGEQHFKCPSCQCSGFSDKESDIKCHSDYVEECHKWGVFVPSEDASWEKGDADWNKFWQTQEEEYSKCDRPDCICPNGPEHDDWDDGKKDKTTDWYIVVCDGCGASGVHRKCGNVPIDGQWHCETCRKFFASDLEISHDDEIAIPQPVFSGDLNVRRVTTDSVGHEETSEVLSSEEN